MVPFAKISVSRYVLLLLYQLEMLEVLACGPVATPLEASFGEEAETEVLMINFVGEVPCTVAIFFNLTGRTFLYFCLENMSLSRKK